MVGVIVAIVVVLLLVLRYQYLQMFPQLARGDANKVFVIPSEFSRAAGPQEPQSE